MLSNGGVFPAEPDDSARFRSAEHAETVRFCSKSRGVAFARFSEKIPGLLDSVGVDPSIHHL